MVFDPYAPYALALRSRYSGRCLATCAYKPPDAGGGKSYAYVNKLPCTTAIHMHTERLIARPFTAIYEPCMTEIYLYF